MSTPSNQQDGTGEKTRPSSPQNRRSPFRSSLEHLKTIAYTFPCFHRLEKKKKCLEGNIEAKLRFAFLNKFPADVSSILFQRTREHQQRLRRSGNSRPHTHTNTRLIFHWPSF